MTARIQMQIKKTSRYANLENMQHREGPQEMLTNVASLVTLRSSVSFIPVLNETLLHIAAYNIKYKEGSCTLYILKPLPVVYS